MEKKALVKRRKHGGHRSGKDNIFDVIHSNTTDEPSIKTLAHSAMIENELERLRILQGDEHSLSEREFTFTFILISEKNTSKHNTNLKLVLCSLLLMHYLRHLGSRLFYELGLSFIIVQN